MSSWFSKFVDFLNDCNTILVKNEREYGVMKELLKRVGLDFYGGDTYEQTCHIVELNYPAWAKKHQGWIIVEYCNGKGFTFFDDIEESTHWYGQAPYTVNEIVKELGGNTYGIKKRN